MSQANRKSSIGFNNLKIFNSKTMSSPNKFLSLSNSHETSNVEGFIDDSLWNQMGPLDENLMEGDFGPDSLPSLTTLVENYGDKLGLVNRPDIKEKTESKVPIVIGCDQKDKEIRETLTLSYPDLMACLNGQFDLKRIDELKQDVQKLIISLEASAGMLKIMYHTKKDDTLNISTPRNLSAEEPVETEQICKSEMLDRDSESPNSIGEISATTNTNTTSGQFSSEFTVLKPNTPNLQDHQNLADLVCVLRNERDEVKSENHRLQGVCSGLEVDKKKLQEELESLEKCSTFIAQELRSLRDSSGGEPRGSGEEFITSDAYSAYAEKASHLLKQIKSDHLILSPRERQHEVVMEGLLQDYVKLGASAAQKAENLTNQLQSADRRLQVCHTVCHIV